MVSVIQMIVQTSFDSHKIFGMPIAGISLALKQITAQLTNSMDTRSLESHLSPLHWMPRTEDTLEFLPDTQHL